MRYKRAHMVGLQKLSSLIDAAAAASSGAPLPAVALSRREQECLIWAARGKSAEEISEVMKIGFGRVSALLEPLVTSFAA
jgi:DNA-binding NarL/FixJ family response regulator